MKELIGHVAQELADHLDDLRETGEGVSNYDPDGGHGRHKVTEVTDAEPTFNAMQFYATVGGRRVLVRVSAA